MIKLFVLILLYSGMNNFFVGLFIKFILHEEKANSRYPTSHKVLEKWLNPIIVLSLGSMLIGIIALFMMGL